METGHADDGHHKRIAPLDAVLRVNTTGRRVARPPGEAEEATYRSLAADIHSGARSAPAGIVAAAVSQCHAGSAAISCLESDGDGRSQFRWTAIAGRLAVAANYTVPGRFSPCQVCVDREEPVLFAFPERRFTYLQTLNVAFVEMLVVPLRIGERAAGTLWIAAHVLGRRLDVHDAMTAARLAALAGLALERDRRADR